MKRLLLLVTVLVTSGARADTLRPQPVCGVDPSTGGCVLMKVASDGTVQVAGSLSVSGTADLPGNAATFNANNVCTAVLAAGEQSVGFHLSAGTLDGTLTPYITNQTGAINCATAGTCTATTFSSGGTIVVTNPNGVKDVGTNLVGGVRQVQVCTTTYNSGSASGVVTATFVQAASSGGGGGSVNVAQVNGVTVQTGAGTAGTGTQRVATATSDGSVLATANTGRLQVDVVTGGGSNASVGTTGAAAPGSATYMGANKGGNLVAPTLDSSGNLNVNVAAGGAAPVSGTPATFNGNGICATIDTGGALRSVGFVLNPGSYNGQVTPSTSKDNSNWSTVGFIRPDTSLTNTFSGILSAGLSLGIQMVSGDRYARVCTSNFNSGTATAFLTATNIAQQQTLSTQLPLSLDGSGFLAVHEQGTATVTGSVTANIGTTNGLALDATLTGGTQKAIVRGGAKGSTTAADVTSTSTDANHQALDVNVNNTPTVTANAGSGTFNIQANASTNLAQINGTTILTGNGTTGAGSPRVTIASDNTPFTVNAAQSGSWTADVSDRAARLLGVVYGSQAQQLKQTATNFNLQVELATGGTLYDARSIRALTSGDTVTAVQATGTNLHIVCDSGCSSSAGFADLGAFTTGTTAINPVGGLFDDTPPTAVTTGKAAAARITNNRALHINLRNQAGTEIGTAGAPVRTDPTGTTTQPISGTVTANIGTSGSLALDASVTGLQVSQGSTTSGQKGELIQGAVTTSAPTYTTGQTDPLSLTTAGALRTDSSATTQPVSGTVTANQGGTWTVQPGNTANTTAWKVDGSAVTQPVSGTVTTTPPSNASTNVAQFGGTNVSTGTGTGGAGIPRVTVSNDSNVLATQSGTWTVQQGGAPWSENITQINGTTILTGAGVTGAGSIRVTNATSDGNVLATANTGRLQVDVVTGGGSNASVGTSRSAAPASSTQIGGIDAFNVLQPLKTEQDGTVDVRITNTNLKLQIAPKVQVSNLFIKPPNAPPTYTDPAVVVTQSPIPTPLCPLQAAISQTAGAITIAGKTGKVTYICKVFIVSTTAQSVSITEGTGSTCGTNPLALAGSTTVANGMALAANGGWVEGTGAAIAYTAQRPGDDVCLLQSGAGNVAGSFSYVQF